MTSPSLLKVDSPFTGEIVVETPLLPAAEVDPLVDRSVRAQRDWAQVSLEERLALVNRFLDCFLAEKEAVARDITLQMGKPLVEARREVDTMAARARHMAQLAPSVLADEPLPVEGGLHRRIARVPVGVVLDIAPWNYPLLTAVNAVVPAVLAGNSVLLKHSPRTPRSGQQFAEAFARAGAPADLVLALQAEPEVTEQLVRHPHIGHVSFTGSVATGKRVQQAAASRIVDVTLELGGKDPAYVAADCDFDFTVENVIDGAFYNAGQSCCAVERAYVHRSLYDRFLEAAVAVVRAYRMGDPLEETTTQGPLALPTTPGLLERQVSQARSKGARVLTGGGPTQVGGRGRFFEPTLVADASHEMSIAVDESFGPVLAVIPVDSDEQAVALMNDSAYGLTASVWSRDEQRADRLARRLEAGTVFLNRCDYLDPALPWVGAKDSGRGCSLSRYGFDGLTRLKNYHFRPRPL